MTEPPDDLQVYNTTPEFTETTVPAGLLRRHQTKASVWGRVVVREGRLLFRELTTGVVTELTPERSALIAPEAPHEVEVVGPVRFVVEFLR